MSEQAKATVQAQPKMSTNASSKGSILQRAAVNTAPVNDVPQVVHDVLAAPGQPLDPDTKEFMESRFGHDFSSVRVHTDAKAAESAKSVNALAYTVGKDIAFGTGQYIPGTIRGKQLLSHELTHIVQQRHAPLGPLQMAGGPANTLLEQEADRVAQQTMHPTAENTSTTPIGPISQAPAILSRKEGEGALPDVDQVEAEAKRDAHRIKFILQDNTYLGPYNQRDIMAIIEPWAKRQPDLARTRLSAFDVFIVALGRQSFEVGWLVSQYTNAFDQLYRRMSDERVEQVKEWVRTRGRTFKDSQPNKEVKFEISKEDVVKGLKLAGDVAAAGVEVAGDAVSAGAATLLAVVNWLVNDLPQLYNQVKSVIDFVEAMRNLKFDDIKKFFTATGIADLMVKALFGEVQMLPNLEKEEEDKGEDSGGSTESKGLMKFFQTVMKIIKAVKKAYSRTVGFVNSILSTINITGQPWFKTFSMVYAGIVDAIEAASNPGAVLGGAVAKVQETIGNFFNGLKTKVTETAGEIKEQVDVIGNPSKLIGKLADKAVEMVLNFIITHPPSPVLKLAMRIGEALAGDTIIGLLRKKIPSVVDEMIKKIAESDVVKKITQPLQGPVASLTGAITNASNKAQDTITGVEGKVSGLLGDGVQMVKEITGIDPEKPKPAESEAASEENKQAARPAVKASSPNDFFGVIKQGIHTRLLARGEQFLLQAGKDLGKAALKKGTEGLKKAGGKIKELILGPKIGFDAHGVHHELWVEEKGEDVATIVASKQMTVDDKIKSFEEALKKIKDQNRKKTIQADIDFLKKLNDDVKLLGKKKAKTLEEQKQKMAQTIGRLLQGDLVDEAGETFSELGKELHTRGREIEEQIADETVHQVPEKYRKFVNQIAEEAGRRAVQDSNFMRYWREAKKTDNWTGAGRRFHRIAEEVGIEFVNAGQLDFEAKPSFELRIAGGKSRLDVLIVQYKPEFMLFEFDYKTNVRSAIASVEEMKQHLKHIKAEFGKKAADNLVQESVSWREVVERALALKKSEAQGDTGQNTDNDQKAQKTRVEAQKATFMKNNPDSQVTRHWQQQDGKKKEPEKSKK